MSTLLVGTLLVGSAVFYVLEALDYLLSFFFDIKRNSLNLILSTPLSVGGLWFLGFWDKTIVVGSLATSLFISIIGLLVNRPTVIRQRRNYL